jgi:hypothetical protein
MGGLLVVSAGLMSVDTKVLTDTFVQWPRLILCD